MSDDRVIEIVQDDVTRNGVAFKKCSRKCDMLVYSGRITTGSSSDCIFRRGAYMGYICPSQDSRCPGPGKYKLVKVED